MSDYLALASSLRDVGEPESDWRLNSVFAQRLGIPAEPFERFLYYILRYFFRISFPFTSPSEFRSTLHGDASASLTGQKLLDRNKIYNLGKEYKERPKLIRTE